jgi:quercetin dioxygenase-like cupin family protein
MSRSIRRRAFVEQGVFAAAALSATPFGLLTSACAPSDDRGARDSASPPPAQQGDARGDAGKAGLQRSTPGAWRGAVIAADEGELVISGRRRAPMRIKVDSRIAVGAAMSMIVSEVAPGASIPVHLHRNEDELIFIHNGGGIATLGDQRVPCVAGAVLYSPRGVWHGVDNTGTTTLTWCAIYSPPGFEQFFRETGTVPGDNRPALPPDEVLAIAEKYGMVFRDG